MARAQPPFEKAGLVVGLCPDLTVYERLASTACERGWRDSHFSAAGSGATVRVVEERMGAQVRCKNSAWLDDLHRLDHLDENGLLEDVGDDPLLEACFSRLAAMPGGGAPWQGSWRGNALSDVIAALGKGGIILVVEARSIEEQRDWARTLLKSGCAFVQTHDGTAPSEIRS